MPHIASRRAAYPGGVTTRLTVLLLGCVVGMVTLLLVGVAPALGHSELEDSTPSSGATLRNPPEQVNLLFNQDISPQFAELALVVGNDEPRKLDATVNGPRVAAKMPNTTDAAPAAGGRRVAWTVGYRVVSADGHPITGRVTFRAPTAQASAGSSPPSPTAAASPTPPAPVETPAATPAEQNGSPVIATIVIGALTAGVAIGASVWLIRARNRGTEE